MHRSSVYLLCMFATCGYLQVNGQLYRNVSRLMDQLLDEYDKRQRPVINQSHTVKVNVSFELLALQVSEFPKQYSTVKISANKCVLSMFYLHL